MTRKVLLRTAIALAIGVALIPANAVAAQPAFREGVVLVKPIPGMTPEKLEKILEKSKGKAFRKLERAGVEVVEVPAGTELATANALNKHPHIAFAEPDMLVEPIALPNDPNYSSQWHLPVMGVTNAQLSAWDYANGKGVIVAVCDTGVNASHPDLIGQTVPGFNTAANSSDTSDVHGHGTWVSGVVAAAANNLKGGASVAPGARVMTMRITDRTDGYAYFSDMAECVTWAADHGARVANISFGGVPGSSTVESAASYMMSKGGLVVVAAGNDGADKLYPNSIYMFTAAATDSGDNRASWSNFGAYVDIAAPGVGIFTTDRGGGYASVSGTSFASPNAAAAAALVMSANPALKPTDVTSIITNTAKDLGAASWDPYFGWGRVNALAATQLAFNAVPSDKTPPTVAIKTPTANATVQGEVVVDVQATDDFKVATVEFLADGMSVATSGTEVSPNLYRFLWNSRGAVDGTHQLTARAKDETGNVGSAPAVSVAVKNAVDTTPPVVVITSPADGATLSGSATLEANASDAGGIASLTISAPGASCSSVTAKVSCTWNLKNVASGWYTVTATATDKAGLTATSSVGVYVKATTTTRIKPSRR